jgi:hypothetical protein
MESIRVVCPTAAVGFSSPSTICCSFTLGDEAKNVDPKIPEYGYIHNNLVSKGKWRFTFLLSSLRHLKMTL